MYKLVGIGGTIRGENYLLEDGEILFGSSDECAHIINKNGVSKKHFSLIIKNEAITLKDLGSSNGTFVNQKLVTSKGLNPGDVIAIPDAVFKLVKLNKKKVYVSEDHSGKFSNEEAPKDLIGRLKYFFDKKLMKPLYALNLSYEWKVMLFLSIFIFIGLNVFLTIESVLKSSNKMILNEVVERASQIAKEVTRDSAIFMGRREYERIDTSYLDNDNDISDYHLFDVKGRVIKPVEKLNIGINDPFSIMAKEWIEGKESRQSEIFVRKISSTKLGVAKAIRAYNLERQREDIVGYISIVFTPVTLKILSAKNRTSFLNALIISSILGFFLALIIYYLTINHFRELKNEFSLVQEGKKREIEKAILFSELNDVETEMNRLQSRVRELSNDENNDFDMVEDDTRYLELNREILRGIPGAGTVLNLDKKIDSINSDGEDILGIRESMSQGSSIEDVLRDQGLAAVIISLCDQSAENNGIHFNDEYDINGTEYLISVLALMGTDSFPKSYLVSFKKGGM